MARGAMRWTWPGGSIHRFSYTDWFKMASTQNIPEKGLPRPVEAVLALAGLIFASPVLVPLMVFIKLTSRGPVLFCQKRAGRGGRLFTLIKLRTMTVNSGGPQVTAKGDSRITGPGRLLRKTKLDELPELWNVVRGDLSLVGPRPEAPKYVDMDDPLWKEVLEARPGITDPVTLALRNEEELLAGFDDPESFYTTKLQRYKLIGYAEYLRDRTWRSDVQVLLRTLSAVLSPGKAPPPTIGEIEEKVSSCRASFRR